METQRLIFFILFSVFLPAISMAFPCPPLLGSYCVIHANQTHVKHLGQFAVTQAHKNLTFLSVVEAQRQVVNGFNYKLAIQVLEGGYSRVYEALVYEPIKGGRKLTKFEPLLPLPSPPLYGGFHQTDTNATIIQHLGESAVANANDKYLSFVSVVEAQVQVLNKIRNYRIAVQVLQIGYSRVYKAEVSVTEITTKIISFKPLLPLVNE
ncbi:hypothetical protein AMTRI_Chr10g230060 [Amborella trichopoda]|uniref:uncharacterized protein LOC105421621 n=1 Tax=Amborella trichopoda TaxID=13333 RepID=UPI0005D3669E|nr:uncharacterized protein LOC105421621 [Amborella trichopoda]|eukprot:XP_011627945.1 uncharacterized protein LOC105421621 [Amborella trichopoda]